MGFLSSLLPIAAGVVGNAVLPGIGAAIGGGLGSAIAGVPGSAVSAAVSGGLAMAGGDARNQAQIASAREQMQFNANQAEIHRDWSAKQAHINRQFQESQSNTAHWREARDLRRAGLNRILSISKGGPGASTPSGAMPSGSPAQGAQAALRDVVSPALNTAVAVKRAEADVSRTHQETRILKQEEENRYIENLKLRAETRRIRAERARTEAETDHLRLERVPKAVQETATSAAHQKRLEEQTKAIREELHGLRVEGEIDQTEYGRVTRYVDRLMKALNAATNVANSARGRQRR